MDKGAKYGCDLHLEDTELRLGLPGSVVEKLLPISVSKSNKRTAAGTGHSAGTVDLETSPATKAQVVGWPPVRSFRMNNFNASSASKRKEADESGIYVKVSMDGAPYLRKIDLKTYRDYQDLLKALEKMFSCFTMGEFGKRDASEYVPTYEDKDGDWMLVGDVPWEMFSSSCKRLRIMKGSEARGLSADGSSHA